MRGYLYVAGPDGREIAGSQRSLAHVERGDGQFAAIQNELKRLAGEDCLVRYSEDDRRLRGSDLGGATLSVLFFAALAVSAWQTWPR